MYVKYSKLCSKIIEYTDVINIKLYLLEQSFILKYTKNMSTITPLTKLEHILSAYLNFEVTPKKDALWLKNMELLSSIFNNPQNNYRTIHIAGSKGKGSTSSFIASILQEAVFETGLFTSPHVSDISERVRSAFYVFAEDVYEEALKTFLDKKVCIDSVEQNGGAKATWFELITLFAFICFEKAKVDWGVFEVGLGGRLDSTNILLPKVCLITPIELEHTQFLGDTLEKVAFEKAGIIKKDIPVFSAKQKDCVKKVLIHKAKEVGTSITFFDDEENKDKWRELFSQIDKTELKLKGSIQKENAKLACLAIKKLYPNLENDVIIRGLSKAFLPCRLESFLACIKNKTVFGIMDGAHTPNSLSLCLDSFYTNFGAGQNILFACADDKDVEAMAELIKDTPCKFSNITITLPGNVKKGSIEKARKAFEKYFGSDVLSVDEDYSKAISMTLDACAKENKALLCVGSFYLCAELKNVLERI